MTRTYSEFHNRGTLIAASALGLSAGMTATLFYSLGTFISLLQAEFGWSHSEISFAVTIMTLGMFVSGTAVGRICDRFGAGLVGAFSLIAYAVGVVVMVAVTGSVHMFWLMYFVIAILGIGSTPIVMIRPITAAFRKSRGFALGIALTGAGIAGFWVPNMVAMVSTSYGWRGAYLALAAIAVIISPLVYFGFREIDKRAKDGNTDNPGLLDIQTGLSSKEARATREFWLLTAIAFTMASGIAGIVVHLTPMLVDEGVTLIDAARIASIIGLASVIGRVVIGLLLDKYPAALVALTVLGLSALGIFLLWSSGAQFVILSAILIGLAAGAEVDFLAYLTALHFGQLNYGTIYGWQYSVFALGYGIAPLSVGILRDIAGDYQIALILSGIFVLIASLLMLGLRHNPKFSV